MSKNIYFEEYSGQYDTFDYFISADFENSGIITVTAFFNHDRINFDHMLKDFKCMLCSIKEYFRMADKEVDESSKASSESREYELKLNPGEHEVTVTLYNVDFDSESLIESFAYSIGYIQSFMLHRFSKTVSE